MNAEQIKNAVREYDALKKELMPVANGFGFEGLTINLKLRSGEQFELAEIEVQSGAGVVECLRGVNRIVEKDKPTRWFAVHIDPTEITWVEFETFPTK